LKISLYGYGLEPSIDESRAPPPYVPVVFVRAFAGVCAYSFICPHF